MAGHNTIIMAGVDELATLDSAEIANLDRKEYESAEAMVADGWFVD